MQEKLTIIDYKHVGNGKQNTPQMQTAVTDLYDATLR